MTEDHEFHKCAYCHLFVDENDAYEESKQIAAWIHLCGDSAEDEALDASHEPVPAPGPARPLSWWRQHGPYAMRIRFDKKD